VPLPSRVQPSPAPWAELDFAQKNKIIKYNIKNRKIKNKKRVCINKNNVNLLIYSLTPDSGIKIPV
jgi:hypothetical protein